MIPILQMTGLQAKEVDRARRVDCLQILAGILSSSFGLTGRRSVSKSSPRSSVQHTATHFLQKEVEGDKIQPDTLVPGVWGHLLISADVVCHMQEALPAIDRWLHGHGIAHFGGSQTRQHECR